MTGHWRLLIVSGVLGLACWAGVGEASESYADRMLFADGLYARQMYDLALKEYAALLKTFPNESGNDAAAFRLAECLRLKGDNATASRFYSHVVANFRTSPFRLRAAYRRARIYADDGDLESAIAHFQVILKENPPEELAAAATFYLGESLQKHGKADDALAAYAQIPARFKDSEFMVYALMKQAEIRRDRWGALLAEGKQEASEKEGELALALFGEVLPLESAGRLQAEALFQRAEIYFRQKRYTLSADAYRALLARFPADERASLALPQAAWSALHAGLYAESQATAQQALNDPARTETHDEWLYIKANSERQLLQYDQAAGSYRTLLARFPASRFADSARYELAVAHYKTGEYDKAVAEAEKIRITGDLRPDVCWLLAESYAAMNRSAEATQYYRIVVGETPTSDRARDAMYRLAYQLQKQGIFKEASRFYVQLADAFPKDDLAPQSLFASAYCLAQAEAHEESVRDWRRLVKDYPGHALIEDALYQKAMGEIRLARRTDASTTLLEWRQRFPQGRYLADSWYWQGMLLFEQAKYAEAEQALREAQKVAGREELQREVMFQLGLVLQKLDRMADAAAIFQTLAATPVSAKFPPALLEWLASYQGEMGAFDNMLVAASLLAQSSEPAWQQAGGVLRGRAELAKGQRDAATSSFKAALAVTVPTPYAGEAALQLGDLALARPDAAEAERYFRIATERAIGDGVLAMQARAVLGLGKAAELGGRHEEASRSFLSVAILYDDPKVVPESLYRAATSLDKLGRKDERIKVVEELGIRYPAGEWHEKARSEWPM